MHFYLYSFNAKSKDTNRKCEWMLPAHMLESMYYRVARHKSEFVEQLLKRTSGCSGAPTVRFVLSDHSVHGRRRLIRCVSTCIQCMHQVAKLITWNITSSILLGFQFVQFASSHMQLWFVWKWAGQEHRPSMIPTPNAQCNGLDYGNGNFLRFSSILSATSIEIL